MGLAAAASVVLAAGAAFATPVDVFDDRKAIDAGLLEIYEVRERTCDASETSVREGTEQLTQDGTIRRWTQQARDLDISVKGKEGGDRFAFKKSLPIDQVAARAKAAAVRDRTANDARIRWTLPLWTKPTTNHRRLTRRRCTRDAIGPIRRRSPACHQQGILDGGT